MAVARYQAENITSADERERVRDDIHGLMTRYGVSAQHISQRAVNIMAPVSPLVSPGSAADFELLFSDPTGDGLDQRMALFDRMAYEVFERGYKEPGLPPPDDIIHVSCAGYLLPSPAQRFVSDRGWLGSTVTHSYHMGCYGAFPAIRIALGLIGSSHACLPHGKERVDIVHTEFLSVHLNLLAREPDKLVTSTLFADGFVKYTAFSQAALAGSGKRGLKFLALKESIIPESLQQMSLKPGPRQFDMFLAKATPQLIGDSISEFVRSLCKEAGVDFHQRRVDMGFAIHPGGPAILDQVRDGLGLDESQIAPSRKVLYEHGNMASASVPHIWKAIVESDTVPVGSLVLSVAFGPGVTVSGALFEKV
ncbi:alkylresorcinol/alkylpyrone synthase [Streptomyces sp. V4I23]|uniref:3-oxoacyl-[acyl-carrier-protein] synthase III C-terminal domain-containing protein n=1 Tax=Streptomyces sp. V4I23 TaxID=3042282 RepID=UPI002789AEF7|nr:3-oxoacyl-[acyl-carrier-protein] synthase III C-terminal domain-containing protein [Streptomyces sp. V4I23]MDQ1013428.1 alkylresorcinol/alkylpyrone synthase [Streptomyces sp. V4I23]